MAEKLDICSLFTSVDGEVNRWGQGTFTTFIRFAGCNLRCSYCDTKYAQEPKGNFLDIPEIMEMVKERQECRKVTITGGEPLLQYEGFQELLTELCRNKYFVSVETNGTIVPAQDYPGCCGFVDWIVDYKLPSSNENALMLSVEEYIVKLPSFSCMKMVIANETDYEVAKKVTEEIKKARRDIRFAFSPVTGFLEASELVNWMKQDKLYSIQLNVQLHKYIWPNAKVEV